LFVVKRILFLAIAKKIESHLSDQVVSERSSTRFVTEVSHDDVPGLWMKDGIQLEVNL